MYYLYLIIILILLIVTYENQHNYENFDLELTNRSLNSCMKFCKTTAGCNGLAYDKDNKICYPSKDFITSKPLNSPFKD